MFPTDPARADILATLAQAFPTSPMPDREAACWWFAARNHERGGSALRDALRTSPHRPAWGQHGPSYGGPVWRMVEALEFQFRGALLRYG
jgi:hypothetical protein